MINIRIVYADMAMSLSNRRGLTPGVYYLTTREIRPRKDRPIELICDYSSTYFDQTSKEERAIDANWTGNKKIKGVDDFFDALTHQVHHDPESFDQARYNESLKEARESVSKRPMRPSEVRKFRKDLGVDAVGYIANEGPEDSISDMFEKLMEKYEEEQDPAKKREIKKEIKRIRRVDDDVREELDEALNKDQKNWTPEERKKEAEKRRKTRAYEHYVSQYTNSQYALNEMDPSGKRAKGKALDSMDAIDFKGSERKPYGWIGTKERGSLYPDAIPRKPRVLPNGELGPRRWINIRNPTPEGMKGDRVKMIGYPEGSYEMQRMKRIAGELRKVQDDEGRDITHYIDVPYPIAKAKHPVTGKYTIPVRHGIENTMPHTYTRGEEGIRRKEWKKEIAKKKKPKAKSRKSRKSRKSTKTT